MTGEVMEDIVVTQRDKHERDQGTMERPESIALHEALEDAGRLYAQYLEVSQVGDVARLAYDAQHAVESPPPSDLPLTLEIHTNL